MSGTAELSDQNGAQDEDQVDACDIEKALSCIDSTWESLTPLEQARVVHLLIARVDFNGASNTVSITFHPEGIKTLADEFGNRQRGTSA